MHSFTKQKTKLQEMDTYGKAGDLRQNLLKSDLEVIQKGGLFKPIPETNINLPSVRQTRGEVDYYQQQNLVQRLIKERVEIGKAKRKYQSKLKDPETNILKNIDDIVADHSQFEHLKTVTDKIDDIFSHTDNKVTEVMKTLVKIYNKKQSNRLNCLNDHDIQKALHNDISFPIGFDSEQHEFKTYYDNAMPVFKDARILTEKELITTYLNPQKIAQLKNSFVEYKKVGGPSVPQLKLKQIALRKILQDSCKQYSGKKEPVTSRQMPLIINEPSISTIKRDSILSTKSQNQSAVVGSTPRSFRLDEEDFRSFSRTQLTSFIKNKVSFVAPSQSLFQTRKSSEQPVARRPVFRNKSLAKTPSIKDSDIRKLIDQYPLSRAADDSLRRQLYSQVLEVQAKATEYTKYGNSLGFLQETDLKVLAERFRCDQNIKTSDFLQKLDQCDDKNLKQLYNFDLVTLQDNHLLERDGVSKFLAQKLSPDKLTQELNRGIEAKARFNNFLIEKVKKTLDKVEQNRKAIALAQQKLI